MVGRLYVDQTPPSEGLKSLVRVTLLVAPILVSLGFFLSVLSPKAERPNGLINLIYLAAVLLAVGVVTLGIDLFRRDPGGHRSQLHCAGRLTASTS